MLGSTFFYLGAALNVLMLLAAVSGFFSMLSSEMSGRSVYALIPVVLLIAWIVIAFWLRAKGKLLAATIMVWIVASPVILYAGIALLFILFGKR